MDPCPAPASRHGPQRNVEDARRSYDAAETWGLEVATLHTYRVGRSGILVHNGVPNSGSTWAGRAGKTAYIYAIRERSSGRIVYVGKTHQPPGRRFGQHTETREHWNATTHEEIVLHSTERAGRRWTDFEIAVWEQHFIELHGGSRRHHPETGLENEINAITREDYDTYRRFHDPC